MQSRLKVRSGFIATPSGTFHARVTGAGDPSSFDYRSGDSGQSAVLLIHGYSPDVNSWRTWEKNTDALAAHCRVYALDLLGYGESAKPEPRLDARGEAKALIELLDVENIARASLVGLSWGGMVAQIIAGTAPARVDKLVLVDSSYDGSERGIARLKKIECPTLIVWDEDDQVIPVAGAQVLANAIPNPRVRIFKRAERDPGADLNNRHWSQVSHSREWNRVVAKFLAEGK